ncbi:MAG: glycosyltransferase family 2 protein, partial [Verrucomicrobiae bacterium]|nr:glycosyltransferase family 2 protein [Verrucomicrobiae bacterium]
MKLVFWISLGLLGYTYIGYFLLLTVLGPLVRRLRRPHRVDDTYRPTVSFVISLHNEERHIHARIDNFEALDYPAEKLELWLGDDCSTDRTREIIRERMARNLRIRLVEFNTHQGKTAVINALVPQTRGEIIAFSDANTFWAPDALSKLVRHYADPRVGAVGGRLILRSPTGVNTDDAYWKFETLLKQRENDLGVQLGAPGGIYTMRKELFCPLQADVIQIDDFIWPVSVYWQGYFGVNEPSAVAQEEAAPHVEAEFRRKVRIGTGDYRALWECRRLLNPRYGWVSFAFWSHKVIRWFAPFLLVIVFVTNAWLPEYRLLWYGQVAFYAAALAGKLVARQRHLLARILRIPYYFTGSNAALLVGFFRC